MVFVFFFFFFLKLSQLKRVLPQIASIYSKMKGCHTLLLLVFIQGKGLKIEIHACSSTRR